MEINSNQPPSSGNHNGGLTNAQRPGEHLRQLRMMQKRELSEVARELNMPERQLAALEADDYKALPEPAFIKGYFRTYARLLGTDSNSLIQRFEEIYTSDTGLPTNHALENSPIKALGRLQRGRRVNLGWLKWLVIVLIIAALIWAAVAGLRAWRNGHQNQHQNQQAAQQTEVGNTTGQGTTTNLSTVAAPTVLTVPDNTIAAVNTSNEDQLSLSFAHAVNVSITDASGKQLASGSQTQPLTVKGMSPFSIRLDDAAAVTLAFNQEQVSLSPYTVNGRADFRLSR